MQPVVVTFIEKRSDSVHVDEIVKEVNKQFEEMGITPIIYIYTNFDYNPSISNIFVKKCLEESFEVLSNRHPSSYVIRQHAHVRVREHVYKWIHTEMMNGVNAILFHWQNPISPSGCWHLNFLVTKNSKYYPKWDCKYVHDCNEIKWGKYLIEHNFTDFLKSHNSSEKKFYIAEDPKVEEILEEGVEVIEITPNQSENNWWKTIKKWLSWSF